MGAVVSVLEVSRVVLDCSLKYFFESDDAAVFVEIFGVQSLLFVEHE